MGRLAAHASGRGGHRGRDLPYEETRRKARELVEEFGQFVEVFVQASVGRVRLPGRERPLREGLRRRRDQGLHRRRRSTRSPRPEIADTERTTPEEAAALVVAKLEELGVVPAEVAA